MTASPMHSCFSHEHVLILVAPHFCTQIVGTLHAAAIVVPPPPPSLPVVPPAPVCCSVVCTPVSSVGGRDVVVDAPGAVLPVVVESGSTPPTTNGAGALHAVTGHAESLKQSARASLLICSHGGYDSAGM